MTNWRFKLEEDFLHEHSLLLGVEFENDFVKIDNGSILIRKGYAWDGCSPSKLIAIGRILPQGLWFGPWDGPRYHDGLTVSHKASLVHDALCQFRNEIHGIDKQLSVDIFTDLLIANYAPVWMIRIYPKVVYHLGPQNWSTRVHKP